jgi:TetR/AcrR family transcriptional regulator, transcriptional repressor of aconitase
MGVNQEDRRAQILEAAFECFLRFGYAKTSMSDIATECKISRSLLYLQFKTKEEIFGATLTDLFERAYVEARTLKAKRMNRRDKLLAMVEAWVFFDWEKIVASPHADELLAEGYRIYPAMEDVYKKRSIELMADLIGDEALTEVVLLSLKGLKADRPSMPVLRARAELLLELVAKK